MSTSMLAGPAAVFPTNHKRQTAIGRQAFTLFELLIATAVIGLILASVVPYIMDKREIANRIQCARNLNVIRDAMNTYATDFHSYPRVRADPKAAEAWTAFTGVDDADPFAAASTVKPNDVTASLWLLVRNGYVSDTSVFICPSSDDWPDRLYDPRGNVVPAKRRGNFRSGHNLSYSMFCPFGPAIAKWDDTMQSGCAILADKNPGIGDDADVTKVSATAAPEAFAIANSRNHGRAGQNVLYADTTVQFERNPYCGSGYAPAGKNDKGESVPLQPGDNIYTALTAKPIPPGEKPSPIGNGVVGHNVVPAWPYDSYLVPTAGE